MPKPGMRWRHVIISTHNSWLPGDPRGFRTRDHKIHSSGDYEDPPPDGEHAGLHHYSHKVSGEPIVIPTDLRPVVGEAIRKKLKKLDYQVLVIAVAGMHTHFLVELPDDMKQVRQIVGQCKTVASHAIRDRLPGRVWAFLPASTSPSTTRSIIGTRTNTSWIRQAPSSGLTKSNTDSQAQG